MEAAGANDEGLPPPEPLLPATEDQAPVGDDLAGGGGPMLGDPASAQCFLSQILILHRTVKLLAGSVSFWIKVLVAVL